MLLFSRSVMSNCLVTPRTVAHQAPLSIGFARQEYWSGLPFPSQGDLPDRGIKHESLMSPALVGRFFTTKAPGKASLIYACKWLQSCPILRPCGLLPVRLFCLQDTFACTFLLLICNLSISFLEQSE